ncbi:MAG: ATP-binding protein [Cyanobacteria bacterium P01_D01_bin.116]
MSSNLINVEPKDVNLIKQVKQSFVPKFLTTAIYPHQELNNYLHKIACKISILIKCERVIVTIRQGNVEQIIASNITIDKGDRHKNIKQDREYNKEFNNLLYYIPLRTTTGEIIGGICASNKQPYSYSKDKISTLELFAELAATKIENYHLKEQQQKISRTLQTKIDKYSKELNIIRATLNKSNHLAQIGEFTTTIIHEIRNALTTVKMGLDYFSKVDNLPQPAKERLSLSISEEKRLERLLQEILLYSKPDNLQLSELEVNNLIDKSLIIIEQMPQAKGRIIEFIPFSQPIHILGDADKLQQIFINILRNACEAVENGEVIQWRVSYLHPDYLRISINNGGNAIPSFMLPKITQPFYSTKSDGTGLGLTIVERIVQAHGGKLSIQSNSITGTTVKVELPVAKLYS